MNKYYILDSAGEPTPVADCLDWARWFGASNNKRIVRQEFIGPNQVSTVFLGLDHNYSGKGPPVLWETMIFGEVEDLYQDRCSGTREQALVMHQKAVNKLKKHYENKTNNSTAGDGIRP